MIGWEETKSLVPDIVRRLEQTAGADRQLDLDIAYALALTPRRAVAGQPEPTLKDGSPVPHFTGDEAAAEALLLKDSPGWTIRKITEPAIDVVTWSGDLKSVDRDHFGDELYESAWRRHDGSTHMEKPPATMAVALMLVVMRGHQDMLA